MAHEAVFISADPADHLFVARLQASLTTYGITTIQYQPGSNLTELLRRVSAMIVVLSPAAVTSLAVQLEYVQGSDLRRPIFSIVAVPCKVPMRLRLFTVLHAETPEQEGIAFAQLARALQATAYAPPPDITPVLPQPARRWRFARQAVFAAVAAVLIVALLGILFVQRNNIPPVQAFAVRHFTPTPTPPLLGSVKQHNIITFYKVPSRDSGLSGMAMASDGTIWFTETGAGQLGYITADGMVHEQQSTIPHPEDLQRGPDGNLWFFENGYFYDGALRVGHLAHDGSVSQINCKQKALNYVVPASITFDRQGNLWEGGYGELIRCNPATGSATGYPANTDSGTPLDITSLTVAGNGFVWFLSTEKGLEYLDRGGAFHVVPTPHSLQSLTPKIMTAADGSVWFTETNYIGHVLADGQVVDYVLPTRGQETAGGEELVTLAPGLDGKVWFTTVFQLDTITPDGHISIILDSVLTQKDGIGFTSYLIPSADGSVWYLIPSEEQIGHYQP